MYVVHTIKIYLLNNQLSGEDQDVNECVTSAKLLVIDILIIPGYDIESRFLIIYSNQIYLCNRVVAERHIARISFGFLHFTANAIFRLNR